MLQVGKKRPTSRPICKGVSQSPQAQLAGHRLAFAPARNTLPVAGASSVAPAWGRAPCPALTAAAISEPPFSPGFPRRPFASVDSSLINALPSVTSALPCPHSPGACPEQLPNHALPAPSQPPPSYPLPSPGLSPFPSLARSRGAQNRSGERKLQTPRPCRSAVLGSATGLGVALD